ncbi:hypothetical protein LCL95_00470 [Bacillus timonensis]|nr:hypothetical protein [Bacillus timonensis]
MCSLPFKEEEKSQKSSHPTHFEKLHQHLHFLNDEITYRYSYDIKQAIRNRLRELEIKQTYKETP